MCNLGQAQVRLHKTERSGAKGITEQKMTPSPVTPSVTPVIPFRVNLQGEPSFNMRAVVSVQKKMQDYYDRKREW